jgi:signal transduction histidine kinase
LPKKPTYQELEQRINDLESPGRQVLWKTQGELNRQVIKHTEELKRTHKQLLHIEKLSAIGQLSASIAHDIKNPLFGIQSVIEGIKRNFTLDEEYRKLSDLALSECDRIKDLINGLLDFDKPSADVKKITDVHLMLDEIVVSVKKEYSTGNVIIKKQYASNLPSLHMVPDQIKQVLLNLLTNAEDAITNKTGTITITTETLAGGVAVRIKDTGCGIAKADLPLIFEPFFTTKSFAKRTGLGLSISIGIIKGHGGDIMVDSAPDQGTTVSILLPLKQQYS